MGNAFDGWLNAQGIYADATANYLWNTYTDSTISSDTYAILGSALGGAPKQDAPIKATGVLGWLDERVDGIASVGRELLEAA